MMAFQLFLILFACFAMYKIYQQYRADKVSRHWMHVWAALWVCVILVALWPKTTDLIAARVGVGRGADLIVYIAIVFLLYGFARLIATQEKQRQELTDFLIATQEKQRQELTDLVRKIAIDKAEKTGS